MAGLFDTLFKLRLKHENDPLEDYTTEIFAHCLSLNKEILYDFLKSHKILEQEFENYSITTQYHLTKINNHDSDSRPDVAIFLDNAVIFFENKVGSAEGQEQLKRYAEHLDQRNIKHRILVYLTRDYEKKERTDLVKDCKHKDSIRFIQLRWYEVAGFFEKHQEQSQIIKEFFIFLKTKNLYMNKIFTEADIQTLNNFSNVTQMMDETMGGIIAEKFENIDGNISQYSARFTQLRNHNRYIDGHSFAGKHWIGFGYWFKYYDEQTSPELFAVIELGPKAPLRNQLVSILKTVLSNEKYQHWRQYSLDDPSSWAGISYGKSLEEFRQGPDHIKAIQNFFLEILDELDAIFKTYIKPLVNEHLKKIGQAL